MTFAQKMDTYTFEQIKDMNNQFVLFEKDSIEIIKKNLIL